VSGSSERPSIALTALLVSLSLVLCLALIGQMLLIVPAYERTFADFRLRVPLLTELIIAASRMVIRYWFVFIPVVFIVFVLLGAVSYQIRHRWRNRWCSALWFVLLLGLPVAANITMWIALEIPLWQLVDGLR